MRLLKKLAIAAVAAMTAMVMAVPAFADNAGTYTITVNNSGVGHTYEAYQIFKGDLHNGVLSNIQWGSGITDGGKAAMGSAATHAQGLTDANAAQFAKEVAEYLGTPSATAVQPTNGAYVLSGLEAGYYLVKDKDETLNGTAHAYTEYIVKVTDPAGAVVNPKVSTPVVVKKTKDVDDTSGAMTAWQDAGDFDMGDRVPFRLEANVAGNASSYDTYSITFHDTLSAGLTFKKITGVYINDNLVADGYEVFVDGQSVGKAAADVAEKTLRTATEIKIVFDDVKKLVPSDGSADKAEVAVEYEAVLNEAAVIGSTGNPNVVKLEYSNNPNGKGTGMTVEDKVTIFTYQLVINKVDGSQQPLAGAGFTLFKIVNGAQQQIGEELVGGDMTEFTWTGLDDGSYVLRETTTPDGYNTISDISFTVTAEHEISSDDPKLTRLFTSNGLDASVTTGIMHGKVVNQAGAQLPTTGGMGTTLLYVAGAALILGAGIALVVRKRARNS